ncbi:hypothetical protein GN956_G15584 [Arapaima gigas]
MEMILLLLAALLPVLFLYRRLKVLAKKVQCDRETQTDEPDEPDEPDGKVSQELSKECPAAQDEVDIGKQFPKVKKSLLEVFDCAYVQLSLYPCDARVSQESQFLRDALQQEFNLVVQNVVLAVRGLDIHVVFLDWINTVTKHLRNFKQANRCMLFNSRQEELSVLRAFAEVLVRKLTPVSLRGLDVNRCALEEIVAFRVLEPLVNFLSNPDTLNQLVVNYLGPKPPPKCAEPKGGQENVLSMQETWNQEKTIEEDTAAVQTKDLRGKKKESRFLRFSKWVKRKKHKKKVEKESNPMFRQLDVSGTEDEGDSVSWDHSNDSIVDSACEDSDVETSHTSFHKEIVHQLSYEMWQISVWSATVMQVQQQNQELLFTIHLEEKDDPLPLQWDIVKSQKDFQNLLKVTLLVRIFLFFQNSARLPSIAELVENTERTIDEKFSEEAKAKMNCFLQVLVSDSEMRHNEDVFSFLCLLDGLQKEQQLEEEASDLWDLLQCLGSFFTLDDGEQQEESSDEAERNADIPQCELGFGNDCPNSEAGGDGCIPAQHEVLRDTLSEASREEWQPAMLSGSTDITESSEDHLMVRESDNTVFEHVEEQLADQSNSTYVTEPQKEFDTSGFQFRMLKVSDGDLEDDAGSTAQLLPADQSQHGHLPEASKPHNTKLSKALFKKRAKRQEGPDPGKMDRSSKYAKALTLLVKEICGLYQYDFYSYYLSSEITVFSPSRKLKGYLNCLDFTEDQVASFISSIREKQWPEGVSEPQQTSEEECKMERTEMKDKAWELIRDRCSMFQMFVKKEKVEKVFSTFQDAQENKKLVYMLLSILLMKIFTEERNFTDKAKALLDALVFESR